VVYEVRDKRDNTNYAAKVFDQLHNEESVKRFNDEIKILEMIKCHPNIIKLIDRYEDQNLRILIFEKVDKEDLFEKIVTKKRLWGNSSSSPCSSINLRCILFTQSEYHPSRHQTREHPHPHSPRYRKHQTR